MPAAIDHAVQARIIDTRRITLRLRYDRADPLAVQLVFPPEATLDGEEVVWTFSRELLETGLHTPTGDGDVHVWPCRLDRIMVELRAPEGVAMVELPVPDLRRFLTRSYVALPLVQEQLRLDLDRNLGTLLG